MVLEVANVHASIEGVSVLRGIDVAVEAGETVALIGRNGAGKTSTFRSVMGLRTVDSGTIRFKDENITNWDTFKRKRLGIGFAPENRQLISKLTARENIEMSLWGADKAFDVEARMQSVLDIFPAMEEFLDRDAGNLSGGQQQMVTVARALIANPDLVLLDEPFEGLAPSIKKDLQKSISAIKNELGTTVFIAESQLNHIERVSDRLYVIERGEIIAQTDEPASIRDDETLMQITGGS
ncbi:ABC transporter ATP-binding protein [Haladaptatus sp. GCM10025707]|uniref:ABC transporter ATP-binding protein n=1 Tax=unclassified Haladaptatus TaxID=2622732 RepID=UPI0023E7D0F7|nr:ABC transporter ATP-binding protein [Haladaptatus sp. QDMS2]